jgi:hypothetical protein
MTKLTKNMTIGKILLSVIAIAVMFIPVYAMHSIESRAISHALEVEGLYDNGTAIDILDFDNDTQDSIDTFWASYTPNYTASSDSVLVWHGGSGHLDLLYRDRATYTGNGSYAITYNASEESGTYQQRKLLFPIDMNCTELSDPDFIRMLSDWEYAPELVTIDGLGMYFIGSSLEVADNNYIMVNTIQTRSVLDAHADSQVYLFYDAYTDPEELNWTAKIQIESYTGEDILTWTDESLYIISVMLCDILLVGAIVFASDPIDIAIDKGRKRR